MDARPHRPRVAIPRVGAENMPSSKTDAVHHRHKSMGNLQAASRAGAMQTNAKRTVFGDVSNVVKNVASANGGASLKGKNDGNTKPHAVQTTQGFSKPAQRPVLPAITKQDSKPTAWLPLAKANSTTNNNNSKLVVHSDDHLGLMQMPQSTINNAEHDQLHNQSTISNVDSNLYSDLIVDRDSLDAIQRFLVNGFEETANVEGDGDLAAETNLLPGEQFVAPNSYLYSVEPAAATSTAPLPRQPRHHKSQPILKKEVEAQPLRRTQSKHFAHPPSSDHQDQGGCKLLDDVTEAAYEDALEHFDDQHIGNLDTCQLDELEKELESSCGHELPLAEPITDLVDSQRTKTIPNQEDSPTTMPIEEYWDEYEEEEVYDDQGYTTAHSYRSRGDLTSGGATTLLAPKITDHTERELEVARQYVEANRTQEDIDDDMWDVCMVAEYGEEIFDYLRELETKMLPDPHYMDHQMEIQWSMRSVLMDWLIQVHSRFSLLPETLFLTVNYIDRFLTYKAVSIGKLQLVGATALLVASKYEEINCPSLEEVVFMVDGSYTVEEILKAERFMLSMLGFELGWPGPMSFLRRISKADEYDLETRTLAKYFLEVTIMDERFVASTPSYLAAGAHCLSRLILKKGDWSLAHVHYSGYTWTQLRPLVSMLLECCYAPQKHHLAVFEKYSDKRYKRAAEYVQGELESGFVIPGRASGVGRVKPLELPHFEADSHSIHLPNMLPHAVELQG